MMLNDMASSLWDAPEGPELGLEGAFFLSSAAIVWSGAIFGSIIDRIQRGPVDGFDSYSI